MIIMEESTWTDARDYCKTYGGDLITLDSANKNTAVMNYAATLGMPHRKSIHYSFTYVKCVPKTEYMTH